MPALVYVVDDETIIASTLAAILKASGFEAEAFFDPLKALAAIQEAEPNILISDVMMPGITGIELAIRVKSIAPSCKVLLFSGQSQTVDMLVDARNDGHNFTLLSKPIHPADLLVAVRALA